MRVVAVVLAAAMTFVACKETGSSQGPTIALEACRVGGIDGEVLCGKHEVYEDRVGRTGRKISLNLVVARSLAPTAKPDPLFVLAGGPGQAATEVAERLMPTFDRIRRNRDIVFLDQRGTGKSNPLECDGETPDGGLSESLDTKLDPTEFTRCLTKLDADPRLYTTPIAMDDLDEVRAALGYEQINLWGGSYGTRAALVYLRQHGAHARTAILDGVAPVDLRLPLSFAKDGQRALDLLLQACEQEASCAKAFPQLRAELDELLKRLAESPITVTAEHPLSGVREPVTISHRAFTQILRGLLYVPEAASLMPLTISRAAKGDFEPFLAQATLLSGGMQKGLSIGMFLSVICAEDAPLVKPEEIDAQTSGTFLGAGFTRDMLALCEVWPRGFVPDGYSQPVSSQVPTLILSGELDPVTPPVHGEAAAKHLPNSKHIVVPGVGHGVSGQGCVPKLIAEFVQSGSVQGLDATCAQRLERPPFFVTFAGPSR